MEVNKKARMEMAPVLKERDHKAVAWANVNSLNPAANAIKVWIIAARVWAGAADAAKGEDRLFRTVGWRSTSA